jgi:hypothetical protein
MNALQNQCTIPGVKDIRKDQIASVFQSPYTDKKAKFPQNYAAHFLKSA